ncbi:MAG: CAP domain-containing protein, partial [Candidatus Sumerlaeia bacterium]|nr:CAP domain-containing protein [Candidatus Sumerlaeia bacterium]
MTPRLLHLPFILLLAAAGCSLPDQQGKNNQSPSVITPPPVLRDPQPGFQSPTLEMGDAEYIARLEEETHRARPRGLPRLERSSALDAGALLHARDMAERNYFAHDSPEGSEPTDRVATAAPLAIVADIKENLFFYESNRLPPPAERATAAHQSLMNSPGHRENILNNRSTHLGLAVVRVSEGGMTREYTVQLFGRDLGLWFEGLPPTSWSTATGANSFPVGFYRNDIELYIVDRDHPGREYSFDRRRYTIGGFLPRLGPNNRSI